ncbi:MAG: hypothetical protein IANPNBLG_03792 [Bryobacteraceae bacterium]|nr:hypothetical protein [Bryobacteraceae bacterium]
MKLTGVLLFLSALLPAGADNLARDTLSPTYEWRTFPYSWQEVLSGEYAITPVHWRRSANNRLLEEGMNSRPVRWDDSTIRVFYGVRGPGNGIFYFDVDPRNPSRIRSGPHGPILSTGPAGSYDDDWLIAPEPVRISRSHIRMYYSAKMANRPFFEQAWSLAMAESFDGGKTWMKYAGNPILRTGTAEWERGAIGFCSVEKSGAAWRMWYLGTNEKAVKQIGYATSADGIRWDRYRGNPVLPVNPHNYWESMALAVPRVIRDGRLLKVWYASYGPGNWNGGQGPYAVGMAESVDGVRWFRSPHNPVMKHSAQGWDSIMTAYPGVVNHGRLHYMWYSGNGYNGIGFAEAVPPTGHRYYRVGATTLPEASWSSWRAVSGPEPAREGYIQFAVFSTIPPSKMYFAGDSLTAGPGAYPEILARILGASYRGNQYPVAKHAAGGAKMSDLARWAAGDLSAAHSDAGVVVIQDAGLTDYPAGKFEKSLRNLIVAAGARQVFIVNHARRPANSPRDSRVVEGLPVEQWHQYWQQTLNPLLSKVAQESGGSVIDYRGALEGFLAQHPRAPLLVDDGVHPAPAGKLFLALLTSKALGFSRDQLDLSGYYPLSTLAEEMINFVFAGSDGK